MTIEQFDKTIWSANMTCTYNGKVFDIAMVDTDQKLIGIEEHLDSEYLSWKRCENVTIN